MTTLTLKDIPDRRAKDCDKRMTLVVPEAAKDYLKRVKTVVGKDPQELVRMLIADFMKRNPIDGAA